MKAYVRLVHTSEGKSPREAEELLKELGFVRIKGTNTLAADVADESAARDKLEHLHQALRGQGVIYEPSIGRPLEDLPGQHTGYSEVMTKWKEIGLDTDELSSLLNQDPERFKARGMEMSRAQLEKVAQERETEVREAQEKERMESGKAKLLEALNAEGGQTIHRLAAISGLDDDTVTQMVDELVKTKKVIARQSGRRVTFVAV